MEDYKSDVKDTVTSENVCETSSRAGELPGIEFSPASDADDEISVFDDNDVKSSRANDVTGSKLSLKLPVRPMTSRPRSGKLLTSRGRQERTLRSAAPNLSVQSATRNRSTSPRERSRPKVRVYRAPNVLPVQKESTGRSFNGSSIIRDYKSLDDYKKQAEKEQRELNERKIQRPKTAAAWLEGGRKKQKASVFRCDRDLSDDEYERIQRLSRPTIATSCRESLVRIPQPDTQNILHAKKDERRCPPVVNRSISSRRFSGKSRLGRGGLVGLIERLSQFDPEKIPECKRFDPSIRKSYSIVNSHLWLGTDYSFRLHNSTLYV